MSNTTYPHETNGLIDGRAYHGSRHDQGEIETVGWDTPGLKVTRFRILTDPGFPLYDVSYCHGVLKGKHVDVRLPFHQLTKRRWKSEIIAHAKRDGVFAKGLGILDNSSALS